LRTNLWAVPAVFTVLAAGFASLLLAFDERMGPDDRLLPWVFAGDADSASTILSTIAGSMITVAGTVYSLTIVALALASAQFAPRLLGGFMRDRTNQVVLGFFVATFVYCVVVLRMVRPEFVPRTAVSAGIILSLISVALLIYFIDHIFHGIQASTILDRIARETVIEIERLYPKIWQPGDSPGDPTRRLPDPNATVTAIESGYVQYIDHATLMAAAMSAGAVIEEVARMGHFVTPGAPLLRVTPPGAVTPAMQDGLRATFALGLHPTTQQDIAYGVRQIVDVGLKALSAAVNDPTTAVNCIDQLGTVLSSLAQRHMPDLDLHDPTGQVRVIIHERTFPDLARLAIDQIRHYGAADHVVMIRVIDMLGTVMAIAQNPDYRAALLALLEHVGQTADRALADPQEKAAVAAHLQRARQAAALT
jgi:uncharacterized membrane protein